MYIFELNQKDYEAFDRAAESRPQGEPDPEWVRERDRLKREKERVERWGYTPSVGTGVPDDPRGKSEYRTPKRQRSYRSPVSEEGKGLWWRALLALCILAYLIFG